jgi:hypothetical protein
MCSTTKRHEEKWSFSKVIRAQTFFSVFLQIMIISYFFDSANQQAGSKTATLTKEINHSKEKEEAALIPTKSVVQNSVKKAKKNGDQLSRPTYPPPAP